MRADARRLRCSQKTCERPRNPKLPFWGPRSIPCPAFAKTARRKKISRRKEANDDPVQQAASRSGRRSRARHPESRREQARPNVPRQRCRRTSQLRHPASVRCRRITRSPSDGPHDVPRPARISPGRATRAGASLARGALVTAPLRSVFHRESDSLASLSGGSINWRNGVG